MISTHMLTSSFSSLASDRHFSSKNNACDQRASDSEITRNDGLGYQIRMKLTETIRIYFTYCKGF